MNRLLVALVAALALCAPARAQFAASYTPYTYVAVATFTAPGTGKNAIAFQNTDPGRDVIVLKVEINNISNAAITGGLMQFWIMGSTVVTPGGTAQTGFYDFKNANIAAPSFVSLSTGPANVVYESNGNTFPLYRPLIINSDEAATANLMDSMQPNSPAGASELILPHGSNRAIVLEQQQLGATNFTAGSIMARITYTLR